MPEKPFVIGEMSSGSTLIALSGPFTDAQIERICETIENIKMGIRH